MHVVHLFRGYSVAKLHNIRIFIIGVKIITYDGVNIYPDLMNILLNQMSTVLFVIILHSLSFFIDVTYPKASCLSLKEA